MKKKVNISVKKTGVILLFAAFLLSGCAKTKEVSETVENTQFSTEEETENEFPSESETEPETEKTEPETESKTETETKETTEEKATENAVNETGETEETVEETEEIEYTVAQVEEVSMYASYAVNIRQGPSTQFERVGALRQGAEVTVTGEASTGWFEIAYKEGSGFVSNKYLQTEPVQIVPQPEVVQTSSNGGVATAGNVVIIGDSRTVDMKNNVGENACVWIAEYSKGIKWFVSDAAPTADPYIAPGTKVIINLGANDPEKIDTYIYTINEICGDWINRGATVYYATVGPCNENPYHTNEDAVNFNASLQNGISVGIQWIDLYGYLVNNGFTTRENDGFHYDGATCGKIYSYYMGCIG